MPYTYENSKVFEYRYYNLIEIIIEKYGAVKGNKIISENMLSFSEPALSYYEAVWLNFTKSLIHNLGVKTAEKLIFEAMKRKYN